MSVQKQVELLLSPYPQLLYRGRLVLVDLGALMLACAQAWTALKNHKIDSCHGGFGNGMGNNTTMLSLCLVFKYPFLTFISLILSA